MNKFSSVIFLGMCLVLLLGGLSTLEGAYIPGPNPSTPHLVKCLTCQEDFWQCTDAADHGSGVCTPSGMTQVCGNKRTHAEGRCIYDRYATSKFAHQAVCPEDNILYYTCNPTAIAIHNHTTESQVCGNKRTSAEGRCIYNRYALGKFSHRITCPEDGELYYACNPKAAARHVHTTDASPAVVCPADSWTSCGGTTSHATTCAAGHTYYTCNPDAVSTHSSHTAPAPPPAVVCPADSWTSCGGTTSHEATCGRGHTYYTCNPDASRYHSRH